MCIPVTGLVKPEYWIWKVSSLLELSVTVPRPVAVLASGGTSRPPSRWMLKTTGEGLGVTVGVGDGVGVGNSVGDGYGVGYTVGPASVGRRLRTVAIMPMSKFLILSGYFRYLHHRMRMKKS